MKKLIENALKKLTGKSCKSTDHEAASDPQATTTGEVSVSATEEQAKQGAAPYVKATKEQVNIPHVRVTKGQVEAYLEGCYPEGTVRDFEYDEHEDKGDVITVMVHCRNLENHRNPRGFMKALTDHNPGMFHDVTLGGWDLEQYDYWEETWVDFKGESGAGFHVSCYKIHRGFDIRMSTGKHGGALFVTEQSLKELEAVFDAFMYVDSLTPTQGDSDS